MPPLPLVQRIIVRLSTVGISDAAPFLFLFWVFFLIPFISTPVLILKKKRNAWTHVQRHTLAHTLVHKILQPSAGAMIVVPSACLTKTLTQQLVVYSSASDNRMCSSIRPQITQCQNEKLSLSLSISLSLSLSPALIGRRCCAWISDSSAGVRRVGEHGGVRGTWAKKKDRQRGGDVDERSGR